MHTSPTSHLGCTRYDFATPPGIPDRNAQVCWVDKRLKHPQNTPKTPPNSLGSPQNSPNYNNHTHRSPQNEELCVVPCKCGRLLPSTIPSPIPVGLVFARCCFASNLDRYRNRASNYTAVIIRSNRVRCGQYMTDLATPPVFPKVCRAYLVHPNVA